MSQKGFRSLEAVLGTFGSEIIDLVITAKDKNVAEDYYSDIKDLCIKNNIRNVDRMDTYVIETEYSFAISWRWIINTGRTKLITLHDSLLPKYRGFAPMVTALVNGETEIGVTVFFANAEFDRGDIIAQEWIEIEYPIKIEKAINKISFCYQNLLVNTIDKIMNDGHIDSFPQIENEATYCAWLDDEDYHIDWAKSAGYIKRFVDSVGFPYKGASSFIDSKEIRILDCEVMDDVIVENRERHYGKVLLFKDKKPVVICGSGMLKINEMMDGQDAFELSKFRVRFK